MFLESFMNVNILERIVRGAGALILHEFNSKSDQEVLLKSDKSPVSRADLLANAHITEQLTKEFPGIPVVSEEGQEVPQNLASRDKFWLVDPLDGTKEFLSGNTDFTVNIAMIEDGETRWGMVFAPALDEIYWGGVKFGSFQKKGQSVQQLSCNQNYDLFQSHRLLASKSHLSEQTNSWMSRIKNCSLVQMGSSLKFCRIADGSADLYPRLSPTMKWDTAAAQAILEGAGGHVFDLKGLKLKYVDICAANPSFIASRWSHDLLKKVMNV